MPLKHNITKYDVLATRIRKIALKNGAVSLSDQEKRAVVMAVLIASFSSGQSWRTHNLITGNPSDLNNGEVKEEYQHAAASRWKTIAASDINEVLNKNISDGAFHSWLFFNVDHHHHNLYNEVWAELQTQFKEACDDIEIIDSSVR